MTLKKRSTPFKEMLHCLFDKETNFRGGGSKKHFFVALTKHQKRAPCDFFALFCHCWNYMNISINENRQKQCSKCISIIKNIKYNMYLCKSILTFILLMEKIEPFDGLDCPFNNRFHHFRISKTSFLKSFVIIIN